MGRASKTARSTRLVPYGYPGQATVHSRSAGHLPGAGDGTQPEGQRPGASARGHRCERLKNDGILDGYVLRGRCNSEPAVTVRDPSVRVILGSRRSPVDLVKLQDRR